jgi:hypothetical protein
MSERSDGKCTLLRHLLAALAYRTQKALRGAPPSFASFDAGNKARTPKEFHPHMTSVLGYALANTPAHWRIDSGRSQLLGCALTHFNGNRPVLISK